MARGRSDKSLARFERIALVLSGGGALGAYQAGAYAALEKCGVRPNWIAGTAIGAVNAAIIAGNLPHERASRLRQFWHELSRRASRRARPSWSVRRLQGGDRPLSGLGGAAQSRDQPVVPPPSCARLIGEAVDFDRVNSGAVRVVLGAVNLATGAETYFDNDRHVLGPDHVLAGTPLPGLPPVMIERQLFGGSAVSVAALDDARPADTLCFAVDGYDPVPGGDGGISRTAREIAAMRRTHDLRRMIALLGERLPPALRGDTDIRRCLAEASDGDDDDPAPGARGQRRRTRRQDGRFLVRRGDSALEGRGDATWRRAWRTRAGWRRRRGSPGVVVHEVRGGVAAPPH